MPGFPQKGLRAFFVCLAPEKKPTSRVKKGGRPPGPAKFPMRKKCIFPGISLTLAGIFGIIMKKDAVRIKK